jgi:hypothetical protein
MRHLNAGRGPDNDKGERPVRSNRWLSASGNLRGKGMRIFDETKKVLDVMVEALIAKGKSKREAISKVYGSKKHSLRGWSFRHQGEKECARRRSQMAKGLLKFSR